MKKLMIIVACLTLYTTLGNEGESKTERLRQTQQLLAQIAQNSDSYLSYSASFTMQTYAGWTKYPAFTELQGKVSENWREVLSNIEEIAPSETHKVVILLASFSSLPLQESRQCLNKIADLCLNNVISSEVFLWVVFRHEEQTEAKYRLDLNTKDPVVAEILRKAKAIDPENEYHIRKAPNAQKKTVTSFWYEDPDLPTPFKIIFVVFLLPILIGVSIIIGIVVMVIRKIMKRKRSQRTEIEKKT